MLDQGFRNITPKQFCKYLGCEADPGAVSYLACTAGDRSFQPGDFRNFNVQIWWKLATRFQKLHGCEPHPALVAVMARQLAED